MGKFNILYIEYILFTSVVWCIFSESFSAGNLFFGGALGLALFKLSEKLLGGMKGEQGNHKKRSPALYMVYLMGEIYINAIDLIKLILTGRLDPVIVEAQTRSQGRVGSVVANSITLTPKTACIDKQDQQLTVLCAHPMTEREILEGFENKLIERGEESAQETV